MTGKSKNLLFGAVVGSLLGALILGSDAVASAFESKAPHAKRGLAPRSKDRGYFKIASVEVREVESTPDELLQASLVLQNLHGDLLDATLPSSGGGPSISIPFGPTPTPAPAPVAPGTNTGNNNRPSPLQPSPMPERSGPSSSEIVGEITPWITLGDKIFEMIKANRPVANISVKRLSVVPIAQQDWAQMEYWQGPMTKTYELVYKNMYGMSVVNHRYTIAFNYEGKYNGAGHYIANATVIPGMVNVSWGFSLTSKVEFGDAVNMGSKADPLPAVSVDLQWSVDTAVQHNELHNSYLVRGDGAVIEINR